MKPLVLVPACNRMMGEHPFHMAGKKYVDAVRLAGGQPLIVPGAAPDELDDLLARADGVLLTGSASNVHPRHFGETVHDESLPLDEQRDAWVLPLIRKVIERGMPLFGICRGFQETNVALGGSLYQHGHGEHILPSDRTAAERYADAHEVTVQPDGQLQALLGRERFAVNSVHGQGVARLAPGLRVEARADDGVIEAFSVDRPGTGFALCVQWHPEWLAENNGVSRALLAAFGQACRLYQGRRKMS